MTGADTTGSSPAGQADTASHSALDAFEAEVWEPPPRPMSGFSAITDRLIDPILDATGVGEGMRIVDVACGPGNLAGHAMSRGADAVGVDVAEAMLARARTIDDGDGLVGTVGSFTIDDDREISYWIAPARWGEGLATNALHAFLGVETTRPLLARVAEHNVASATVLVRAGFRQIGSEKAYAAGVGREVVEHIYRLER